MKTKTPYQKAQEMIDKCVDTGHIPYRLAIAQWQEFVDDYLCLKETNKAICTIVKDVADMFIHCKFTVVPYGVGWKIYPEGEGGESESESENDEQG